MGVLEIDDHWRVAVPVEQVDLPTYGGGVAIHLERQDERHLVPPLLRGEARDLEAEGRAEEGQ